MRTVVQGLTYIALLAAVVILPHWIAYTLVPDAAHNGVTNSIVQCATEDSTNCYWNAATMGNGTGNSFIDVNGTAYYVR